MKGEKFALAFLKSNFCCEIRQFNGSLFYSITFPMVNELSDLFRLDVQRFLWPVILNYIMRIL